MALDTVTRKALFKAALMLAGKTANEWAKEQDVTPQHLSLVLGANRESQRLTDAIEAFIKSEGLRAPRQSAA
jgi:hypothetical protein